jgi:hypothetical protein
LVFVLIPWIPVGLAVEKGAELGEGEEEKEENTRVAV